MPQPLLQPFPLRFLSYGLEGIVSKLASSRYRSGRSRTWLKCKCFTESAFLIIGTARDRKTGAPLAGSAFIALSGNEREELWRHLESLKVDGARSRDSDCLVLNG